MIEPLTVYTLPNCVQCTMTKGALDAGLPYTVIDRTTDARALDLMKQFGYTSAPHCRSPRGVLVGIPTRLDRQDHGGA